MRLAFMEVRAMVCLCKRRIEVSFPQSSPELIAPAESRDELARLRTASLGRMQ
jgi:hypothetical protein